jgi:hypothetical protein
VQFKPLSIKKYWKKFLLPKTLIKKFFKVSKKYFTVLPNTEPKNFNAKKKIFIQNFIIFKKKIFGSVLGNTVKYFFETLKNFFIHVLGNKNFGKIFL